MAIWLIVGLSIVCVWIWCLLFILEYGTSRHEQKLSSEYMVNTQNVTDAIREVKTGPKTLRSLHPDGRLFPSPNGNVPMKDVEIKTIKRAENSP